jgi:hypothetical protein
LDEPIAHHDAHECDGKCVDINNLIGCDVACRNAPFRRLLIGRILKRDI